MLDQGLYFWWNEADPEDRSLACQSPRGIQDGINRLYDIQIITEVNIDAADEAYNEDLQDAIHDDTISLYAQEAEAPSPMQLDSIGPRNISQVEDVPKCM